MAMMKQPLVGGFLLMLLLTACVINTSPVAINGELSLLVNETATFQLEASDKEESIEALTFSIDDRSLTLGEASLSGRTLSYTAKDKAGTENLRFKVTDSEGETSSATVQITIKANTEPIAKDASLSAKLNETLSIELEASDAEDEAQNLLYELISKEFQYGRASLTGNTLNYRALGQSGTETIEFSVTDSQGLKATATVKITVSVDASNTAPIAQDAEIAVLVNDSKTVTLAVSDNEDDISQLSFSINAQQLKYGSIRLLNKNTVMYTAKDSIGEDSFSYTVTDSQGSSDTARVSISVSEIPENNPPVAQKDISARLEVNTSTTITLSATDIDGDALTFAITNDQKLGTASLKNNVLSYTAGSVTGTESLQFTVTDSKGATDAAIVSIAIEPANQPPVAPFC